MTEEEFYKSLLEIGIELNDKQKELFEKYADVLIEYNKHTNLTAIRTKEDIYLKHFYDSLLILKFLKLDKEEILDMGSGAGFPGVPLKIICPNIKLTLLDSNGKKTKFLEILSQELNVEYSVINDRAEKYIKNKREYFDIVVSRAVAAMPVLAELCIPFVKLGGKFIPYKGILTDDLEEGIFSIETLGGKLSKIRRETLCKDNALRNFPIIFKNKTTPEIYPRQFEKIIKKPLKKNIK